MHLSEIPNVKPRHFAIDLDDTFLTLNEDVLKQNLLALKKARSLGYNCFFCTGRSFLHPFRFFHIDVPGISGYNGYPGVYMNGSLVYNDAGTPVVKNVLDKELLRQIMDGVKELGFEDKCVFFTEDTCYTTSVNGIVPKIMLEPEYNRFNVVQAKPEDVLNMEILMITGEKDDLMKLKNLKIGDKVATYGHKGDMHFIHINSNKSEAISELMKYYGEDAGSCAFIGDGLNDVDAMKVSNNSFAVGNAHEEVKHCAKYVLEESNDEGAVGKLLGQVYNFEVTNA